MRRTAVPAVIFALVLALTGCGGEEKKDKELGPVGDAADTPSATPASKATPGSPKDSTPLDDQGNDVIRGTINGATTPEAQAVVEAWFAYWEVRVHSFGRARVDPKMGSVAAADALADVVQYVAHLRSKKLHTVGDTRFGVSNLKVRGANATLRSCGVNKSIDRTVDGSPAEQFTPFFTVTGALTQVGGVWRVTQVQLVGKSPCKA
ncbi:MAG: hypothetical protein ABIR34_01305 [Marmoricola sp.]